MFMIILTVEEAKKWAQENLYEADSYLSPLKVVVKKGLLIPIDGEHFAVREVVTEHCTWIVDSIRRLTDEEMTEQELYHRYRYIAHAENFRDDYHGVKEVNCGIL